jgi:hypothetical protein
LTIFNPTFERSVKNWAADRRHLSQLGASAADEALKQLYEQKRGKMALDDIDDFVENNYGKQSQPIGTRMLGIMSARMAHTCDWNLLKRAPLIQLTVTPDCDA